MSNASSPSGNKSPEILLPDYIEDLRQKNKLTAGDFAGEKLEELAAEFVKTLSDDSKVKLNIDKVTRKVGISLVDDDNHVRYASACETVLKDKGEVVTLVVNKPLDGKYMFRVSDKGPPIVLASTVKAVEKKNGFKALNEAALITPVWKNLSDQPDFGITYFYDHGVPLVGFQPKAVSDPLQPAPFVWQLTQYCAYDPDKPDEVGEERFIFTGNSKDSKKKHSLQGYYMRLEDLRRRVETDNANTAWEDMERFKKNQPLYDLWYPDGKLVPVDRARVAFNPLEPKGSNSGDKIFQAKNLFLSHCQIARLARVNEGLYDVLSRFWDGPWETSFILQIDPKYKDQIRKSAKAIATDEDIKNLDVNPKWEKEDIPMMALIENIKTERQFQPKLSILWSTGDIDQPNPSVISLDKWASHPNSLYSLWVDSKDHLDIMHKTKLPVWLPFRDGPSSDDLKASDKNFQDLLKSKGTYKDVKTAATTMTQVTKTSINVVKSYKRTPDQIGAMGGISPNDLVRKWWKLGQKEKAAEWLHRSAWSYGGLYDGGKLNPQSSQVMSNLVIGTHEANTLMIRHEIFVKRLAEYGKNPANKGVTVQVTTSLHKMFEETLPEYAWFCPRLHYKVETLGTPDVAANFTYDFYLLDRRLPTRLELDLDELLERLAYGWGNSDFMTL